MRARAALSVVNLVAIIVTATGGVILAGVAVTASARPVFALGQTQGVRTFSETYVDWSRVACRAVCGPRVLVTHYYAPVEGGPYPVVVFAHGFDVTPSFYDTLLFDVAAAGYEVAAPEFPESTADGPCCASRLQTAQQAGDMSFVLSVILGKVADPTSGWSGFASPFNPTVMGHSDGALSAAALVEGSSADPRLAGGIVVAGGLDPAVGPFGPHIGHVLVVHGDADEIDPFDQDVATYNSAAGPRALLVGSGRSHAGVILDADAEPARQAIIGWLDWTTRNDVSGLGRFIAASSAPGFSLAAADGIDTSPIGSVDVAANADTGVSVSGWALDPDVTGPIDVTISVDGAPASTVTAALPRPDVGRVYGDGDAHGFAVTVPASPGYHGVCATAHNAASGNDAVVGCLPVVVVNHDPIGHLDLATAGINQVRLVGWALDPDTTASIPVAVYIDGVGAGWFPTTALRADVAAANLGQGAAHGFDLTLPVAGGRHTACTFAINQGPGSTNPALGCTTIDVPDGNPIGALDRVGVAPGGLEVSGWAVDPSTTGPVTVHTWIDGTFAGATTATSTRPDVAAAYPGFGNAHGYNASFPTTAGPHQVCTYAINIGPGTTNTTLGCANVTIGSDPIGALDRVAVAPGGVVVSGWAIDPCTTGPVTVHTWIDGTFAGATTATSTRPDVAAAYPGFGNAHGYNASFPTTAGPHQVCTYAINIGPGTTNTTLGCATVTTSL